MFKEKGLSIPHVNAVSFSIPLHNALLATGNFLSSAQHADLRRTGYLKETTAASRNAAGSRSPSFTGSMIFAAYGHIRACSAPI